MLRVSKLTDYATVVLAAMAREPDRVHTAADLSERTHLGRATVSKLLKQFVRNGLLTSYRGAHGGYLLAVEPERVSAAQIIDLVEGPMAMTECGLENRHCEFEGMCGVDGHWQRINRAIRAALEEISLADLAAPTALPLQRIDLRRAVTGVSEVNTQAS